jgi:ABC-type amino acid transport substrate-binding protein
MKQLNLPVLFLTVLFSTFLVLSVLSAQTTTTEKRTITIVHEKSYQPYYWMEGDSDSEYEMKGIIPELLKIVTDESGIVFKYEYVNGWSRGLNLVMHGKKDAIIALFNITERAKSICFLEGHITSDEINSFFV